MKPMYIWYRGTLTEMPTNVSVELRKGSILASPGWLTNMYEFTRYDDGEKETYKVLSQEDLPAEFRMYLLVLGVSS